MLIAADHQDHKDGLASEAASRARVGAGGAAPTRSRLPASSLVETARRYLRRGNLQPAASTVCHTAVEARAVGDEGHAGTGWLLSEPAY
jgi:hypothetical protein